MESDKNLGVENNTFNTFLCIGAIILGLTSSIVTYGIVSRIQTNFILLLSGKTLNRTKSLPEAWQNQASGIVFLTKIAEFAIILELNGYSGCLEIG